MACTVKVEYLRFFFENMIYINHLQILLDYNFEENVYHLLPFYITYTAFVPLHAKFAVTVNRIGIRYRCLNDNIQRYVSKGEKMIYQFRYMKNIFMGFVVFFCWSFAANKNGDFDQVEGVIHRFIRIYDSLGKVLQCESRCYFTLFII